jgi:DNA-binding NarL/FixJ family response regulator
MPNLRLLRRRSGGQPLKALLVEDSPIMRELLTESLAGVSGVQVAAIAETAADAVTAFESHLPDIVILDLALRVGSGLEVLREIKRSAPDCLVMVFTGYDQESFRQHCLAAGADHFFSKNRQHDQLIQLIQSLTEAPAAPGSGDN